MEEIKIPEGTKSMTCNIEGNKVIIEFIPKEEFEDGDIIIYNGEISIFKTYIIIEKLSILYDILKYHITLLDNGKLQGESTLYKNKKGIKKIRHATEQEKQKLFDAMAKEGLKWNAEKKQIEKMGWRAYLGCKYFYFTSKMSIESCQDVRDGVDTARHDIGNYFKTEEEAEQKAEQIKKILKGE